MNLQHQHKTSHFQLLATQHDLHDDEPPAAQSVSTAARSLLSLSLFLSSCIRSLSRTLSLSFSLFDCLSSLLHLLPSHHPPRSPPPPSLLFSPTVHSLFFYFFLFSTSPLIFPAFTLLLTNQGRDHATVSHVLYMLSLSCLSTEEKRDLSSASPSKPLFPPPQEARSFTRYPCRACRAAFGARERGSRNG